MEGSAENKPRSRRRPARTRIAPGEKAICLLLLAAIPVAAGAIYTKGKHYDPRLFSPDASLTRAMSRRAALPTKIAAENSVLAPAMGTVPVAGASGVPAGMAAPGMPVAPGSL
ncbi:MAG TPA: hypothetical protein VHR86_04100, partial [Armatimonadota bacterium]|nr:hypothetical protein [Armatimonadota bacterium]